MSFGLISSRQPGAVVRPLPVLLAPRIYIDDSDVAIYCSRVLPPDLTDFVDVAGELFKADRITPFNRQLRGGSKTRTIRASLPVKRLAHWNTPKARGTLAELLEFLTDDEWDLEFRRRERPHRYSESQRYLLPRDRAPSTKIALLSGGLDSFAGIGAELAESPSANIDCVSVVTNGRWEGCQKNLAMRLRDSHCGTIRHIRFKFHMEGARAQSQPSLRRTRGLLFLTSGLVTAAHVGSPELLIFENGVGAINLPYDRGNLGQTSSKAAHPTTLRLMEELFAMVSGRRITIRNPCELKTKAEMCRALPLTLRRCISRTYSCDTFGARRASAPQCGTCTSCILRLLSLRSVGLGKYDPPSAYEHDARSLSKLAKRRLTQGLAAMDWQVERISRSIAQNEPWRALVSEFPDLAIVADEFGLRSGCNNVTGEIIDLHRRFCDEFRCFRKTRTPSY